MASFPARVWLRLDSLTPLSCSVRFVMVVGEGHLSWGASSGHGAAAAVRAGTAAGLVASDLAALVLSVRAADGQTWVPHPLHLRTLPRESRTSVGAWLELDVAKFGRDESTDLVFDVDLLDADFSPEDLEPVECTRPQSADLLVAPADMEVDAGAFDVPLVSITDSLPETPSLDADPSSPGGGSATVRSSLVRALVQRIRIQEEEIKTLRQQLEQLRIRLDPSAG
jgi:hypothetical protein